MWNHRIAAVVLITTVSAGSVALAHCEIPCGIYGDRTRVDQIAEHVTTLEKSMKQIVDLGKQTPRNDNQIVRWVVNKEQHADEIQHVVTQYFMTQRIKPADPKDAAASAKYVTEITLLHRMLIAAMKCKQTTDPAHCADLRALLKQFADSYFGTATRVPVREHHGSGTK